MNSMKLFNLNYFIQNMKKSKSGIIFAMIILPLFTMLSMLLISSENYSMVMGYSELNVFNILFMYVVPIVLSISLFSYVFKKNSSDLIGSMPLSRKTIFITNTIGGIAIILLIQIVTAIMLLITSLFASNLVIFGSMVWDSFVYFTISYIFVFVTCNLAMSFSGNMFATIAGTMLILFFIPFLLFTSRASSSWSAYSYYNYLNKNEENTIEFYDRFNFTGPSYIMDCIVNSCDYEFNIPSMLKMIGLSCVYFALGFVLFNKKKFEMAGESYENDAVHLVVKFLSLAPFFAIGVQGGMLTNPISFVFFFAVVAVYYFLFDIITKKKIKLWKSFVSFIAFSLMMYALFALFVPNLEFISKRKLSIDDIDSVTIASLTTDYGNDILTNIVVKDKNLIYGMLEKDSTSDIYYSGYTGADLIVNANNKKYTLTRADVPNIKKILEKYGDEEFNFNIDNYRISLAGAGLTTNDCENLKEAIRTDLEGITYKKLYSILKGDREVYSLKATNYVNHKLIEYNFNASEMRKTVYTTTKVLNQSAYKHANEYDFANMTYLRDFRDYMIKKNPEILFDDYEEYDFKTPVEAFKSREEYVDTQEWAINVTDVIFDGLKNIDKVVLRDYLYEHKDDELDINKPYFAIWFVTTDGGFYSNDIEGFYKMLAKAFNEHSADNYDIRLNEM